MPETSQEDDKTASSTVEKPTAMKTQDQLYSRTVNVTRVEKFKWTFETWKYDKNKGQKVKQEIKIEEIEAIYINPRWKTTKVGEFLSAPVEKIKKEDSDSDDQEYKKRLAKSNQNGVTIEDFKKLTIPDSVMKDGMIFIWVEKEHIAEIICHLETQNFFYVENVCYVMLDPNMRRGKSIYYCFIVVCRSRTIQHNRRHACLHQGRLHLPQEIPPITSAVPESQ